jgi:putative membrane protein
MWGCNYFPYFSLQGGFYPGGLFSILLWGLLIMLLVFLVLKLIGSKRLNRTGPGKDREDSMDILKVRYAKGEISKDEFFKMQNVLLRPL